MSIATAIERFRLKQAEQFSDTVTVARPTGEPTYNATTETYTQATVAVYSGPAKIRPAERVGLDVQADQTEVRLLDMRAKFPVDTDIRREDLITVTASTYDAGMVGKQFRVVDAPADAWQISRAVSTEEVTAPGLGA